MLCFSEAVALAQPRFGSAESTAYVRASDRLVEAGIVGPCVWRMAFGELDSTEALTASRTGLPGSPPSLARKLGKRLARAPLDSYVAVVEAIYRATAIGYTAQFEQEAAGVAEARRIMDRSTEHIWDFWAFDFRDMLEEGPASKTWASEVRALGADSLVKDLKGLGLWRLFGDLKLREFGFIYAQAGVWLRIDQTNYMNEAFFEQRVKFVRNADRRSFDAYPDEDPNALDRLRSG